MPAQFPIFSPTTVTWDVAAANKPAYQIQSL
jgi:hypothetical protein